MKRIFLYSAFLAATVTLFNSCRKDDNPKLPDLEKFDWMPTLVKDQATDLSIPAQDPASFSATFTIDKYFEADVNPQKVDVVAIKNNSNASVKLVQADINTFPATVTITGAQLEALFGPIALGDNITVGVDITTPSGKKFEAFPAAGAAYAAGITAQPGASPTINYLSACAFEKSSFNGTYKVAEDTWQDFNIGDAIAVSPGAGDNEISIIAYPSPAYGTNRKPMIITVNPTTFAVNIAEQVIGDYAGSAPGSTIRGTGTVNPCGDEITLNVIIKLDGVDYERKLRLTK